MKNRLQEQYGSTRGIFLLLLLCFLVVHSVSGQQGYFQQQVSHRIDVTLNDAEHTLDGFEKIEYTNNAPDTLHYIWFHIWPNAFKNDKTAFSEQLLLNGKTDFYFSDKEARGYINRLDFKVNGTGAKTEDHPQYIDVVKVLLPEPLTAGKTVTITTAFHVKLPHNFSRGGHKGQSYQVTQWYPKPAVYDRKGWHVMPYLDQGEFYNEFGNYDVRITLPANYVVAATGELMNEKEKQWLTTRHTDTTQVTERNSKSRNVADDSIQQRSVETKTLHFVQEQVHDFAWFADKRYRLNQDTMLLPSGRMINLFYFFLPESPTAANVIAFMKESLKSRSAWLGEYPYATLTVAEAEMGVYGGMEYPTITSISPMQDKKDVDLLISHEIGHNWFQGIIATNERRYPWMDEGMNSYYDDRYNKYRYGLPGDEDQETFITKRFPLNRDQLRFESLAAQKKDQPINTHSAAFNRVNYELISYYKASEWMKQLERELETTAFDSAMKNYVEKWKFRHPYPEDFQKVMQASSEKNLDSLFRLLNAKGSLVEPVRKEFKVATYFNLKETNRYNYLSVAPAAGYNRYDGVMIGLLAHNYQLPLNRLQFVVAPLYATKGKAINGIGRIAYSGYPASSVSKWELGLSASHFTMDDLVREKEGRLTLKFMKLTPFIKIDFHQPSLSQLNRYLQLKTFFIREEDYDFRQEINGTDTSEMVDIISNANTIAELKYVADNNRALYPYRAELSFQQGRSFGRLSFTGNYFFNYAGQKGGIQSRIFAGKFFHMIAASDKFSADRFLLNLTGAKGDEDYTYSNYFIGRNEFQGWQSQQIMIRDGAFKVGTDLQSDKIGKTDNWLVASNFVIDVPAHLNPLKVLPIKIPLKLFVDVGTYADAWQRNSEDTRFLYDAGFQFSFFKETVNIYLPVLYSRVYRNYYRSMYGDKYFFNTISFSINFSALSLKKVSNELIF